jgi:hypothetical protein
MLRSSERREDSLSRQHVSKRVADVSFRWALWANGGFVRPFHPAGTAQPNVKTIRSSDYKTGFLFPSRWLPI